MKKVGLFVLPLCAGALCACNEPVDVSADYFDSLGDSVSAASKNSSFRAYSDTVKLNAALKYEEEGEEKAGSISFDPLAFDLRVDNVLDGNVDSWKASLFGKNNKMTKVTLGGDFAIGTFTSVEMAPRLYVDAGTLYSDLTDAGTLRILINTYFGDYLESTFPTKAKLSTGLPGGLGFDVPDFEKAPFVSKLTECYKINASSFGFAETEGIKTVSFASTDEAQLGLILETLRGNGEDELVSAYEGVTDKFTLTKFQFDLSYTSIGPTGVSFNAGILFSEDAFPDFQPDGEWALSGKVNFAYGEYARAQTVSNPDSYTAVNLKVQLS